MFELLCEVEDTRIFDNMNSFIKEVIDNITSVYSSGDKNLIVFTNPGVFTKEYIKFSPVHTTWGKYLEKIKTKCLPEYNKLQLTIDTIAYIAIVKSTLKEQEMIVETFKEDTNAKDADIKALTKVAQKHDLDVLRWIETIVNNFIAAALRWFKINDINYQADNFDPSKIIEESNDFIPKVIISAIYNKTENGEYSHKEIIDFVKRVEPDNRLDVNNLNKFEKNGYLRLLRIHRRRFFVSRIKTFFKIIYYKLIGVKIDTDDGIEFLGFDNLIKCISYYKTIETFLSVAEGCIAGINDEKFVKKFISEPEEDFDANKISIANIVSSNSVFRSNYVVTMEILEELENSIKTKGNK